MGCPQRPRLGARRITVQAGLSQEIAERMFVSAVLEQAAIDAPCTAARAGVLRLGEKLTSGFASLFEDE